MGQLPGIKPITPALAVDALTTELYHPHPHPHRLLSSFKVMWMISNCL